MRRRTMVTFLILNIFISVGIAFAIINITGQNAAGAGGQGPVQIVNVVVTATPDPNVSPNVIIITATLQPSQIASLPDGVVETSLPSITGTPPPTFDAEGDDELALTATALPPNCIPHAIQEGETPFSIAEIYGADGFELLAVNNLSEEDARFLQIGDILIVPLEGCSLIATSSVPGLTTQVPAGIALPEETEAVDATLTPSPSPTITLAPTASNAQVEIVQVIGRGDITAERVEIRNNGPVVNLEGWTLSDAQGNTYVFPARNFFTGGSITVYSGDGENTAILLYWGRNEAVFGEEGDVLTLADSAGIVQATLRLTSPVDVDSP